MDFYSEVFDFYLSRRRVLRRRLLIRWDYEVENFCRDSRGAFSQDNMRKLCMLFSGVLGERLPDSIHNRLVLTGGKWVSEYLEGVRGLKPPFWGFNLNRNRFPNCGLGMDGWVKRYRLM